MTFQILSNNSRQINICSVDDCNNHHTSKGMCHKHYQRLRRTQSTSRSREDYSDKSLSEIFWIKTEKRNIKECWLWKGWKFKGYGGIYIRGKTYLAHRLSWIVNHGEIPDKLHVLHKCDNPSCVNPKHLFLGTHQDNMSDRNKKGRCGSLKGEANGFSILTNAKVLEIKKRLANGEQGKSIAENVNISPVTISAIKTGRLWKHIKV